jgi:carbon monoxide dehydrogenase subunit G
MDLHNTFTVAVPPAEAWAVLTDLERIAPCMPGARLTEVDGDEFKGEVKIKVGPITATYKGVARFVERDEAGLRAVLRAEGRDARQGNAHATITATLEPAGDGTSVTVATDLTISGKVAQLGRGMLGEVSTKLIGQFVESLDAEILHAPVTPSHSSASEPETTPMPEPAAEPPAQDVPDVADVQPVAAAAPSGPRRIESAAPKPVDLLSTAGAPVAKRLVPVVGGTALLLLAVFLRRRRRRG